MSFWNSASEMVPCCGDDAPQLCLVALEHGAVALARYIWPKNGRPYWETDSGFGVTHWAFIPDVPNEN